MTGDELARIRNEYKKGALNKASVSKDPFIQFRWWMDEVLQSGVPEPNVMALATASPEGAPSVRYVLLKGVDESGFIFFTNYESRKAAEIRQNDRVALAIYWMELERQVRVEGRAERIPERDSDLYFETRPIGSQVSAIISPQSQKIPDRKYLEDRRKSYLDSHEGINERPGFWGGYRLLPTFIEFWQGRSDRLHDRILYTLQGKDWQIDRLAP